MPYATLGMVKTDDDDDDDDDDMIKWAGYSEIKPLRIFL